MTLTHNELSKKRNKREQKRKKNKKYKNKCYSQGGKDIKTYENMKAMKLQKQLNQGKKSK